MNSSWAACSSGAGLDHAQRPPPPLPPVAAPACVALACWPAPPRPAPASSARRSWPGTRRPGCAHRATRRAAGGASCRWSSACTAHPGHCAGPGCISRASASVSSTRQCARIVTASEPVARGPARQFAVEEGQVEGRVVDDQLGAVDELQEAARRSRRSAACSASCSQRHAVHRGRAGIDLALGVQVLVEVPAGGAAVDHLDAADLDDAMAQVRFEAGGFGIQYDLSQAMLLSAAMLPQATHRSPRWPAHRRVRCRHCRRGPSPTASWTWCGARAASSACHRSRFFTGFLSAVFQPRCFHCGSHSSMPVQTYFESVYSVALHRPLQRLQCLDGRGELHAVVGGGALGAGELAARVAGDQQRTPAARPRIAPTGPVRVDLDLAHEGLRLTGSGRLPNTRPTLAREAVLAAASCRYTCLRALSSQAAAGSGLNRPRRRMRREPPSPGVPGAAVQIAPLQHHLVAQQLQPVAHAPHAQHLLQAGWIALPRARAHAGPTGSRAGSPARSADPRRSAPDRPRARWRAGRPRTPAYAAAAPHPPWRSGSAAATARPPRPVRIPKHGPWSGAITVWRRVRLCDSSSREAPQVPSCSSSSPNTSSSRPRSSSPSAASNWRPSADESQSAGPVSVAWAYEKSVAIL